MYTKWLGWRLRLMILVATATLLLSACGYRFWEPRAPERSFMPEDLLVGAEIMPSAWGELGHLFPAGYDLCTTECAAARFGVADRDSPIQAEHDVFRYLSAGIARRTFEIVYLPTVGHFDSVSEWTYQSPIAEQSYFGCYDWEGRATPVCEWAGQYEEYIVVLWTRMTPAEVSLADVERVVRAIDEKMALYLGKTVEPTPGTE